MHVESTLQDLKLIPDAPNTLSYLRDLFPGITNILSLDSLPQQLFKTQANYLNSLELPLCLQSVVVGPAVNRYICFNENDTKTVLFLPKQEVIYDPEPFWLKMLPTACTNFSNEVNRLIDSEFIFTRGSMSFAHFLSGELGSLLTLDRIVKPDVPIHLPFAKKWHYELFKFFGIKRRIVTSLDNITSNSAYNIAIAKYHVLDHLEEYQGLSISRYFAQKILARRCIEDCNTDFLIPNSRILWLTRHNYERSYSIPHRMLNFVEAHAKLTSRFEIEFCNPEEYSIETISRKVYQSRLLICESGSLFMNYLLFASRFTKIIQLAPQHCLGPTWSFYNINNMQWYWPVLSHLQFFEGSNQVQFNRKYGSPWNVPSTYDIDELSRLIAHFDKRG